jgi:hypothetical protein
MRSPMADETLKKKKKLEPNQIVNYVQVNAHTVSNPSQSLITVGRKPVN